MHTDWKFIIQEAIMVYLILITVKPSRKTDQHQVHAPIQGKKSRLFQTFQIENSYTMIHKIVFCVNTQ